MKDLLLNYEHVSCNTFAIQGQRHPGVEILVLSSVFELAKVMDVIQGYDVLLGPRF